MTNRKPNGNQAFALNIGLSFRHENLIGFEWSDGRRLQLEPMAFDFFFSVWYCLKTPGFQKPFLINYGSGFKFEGGRWRIFFFVTKGPGVENIYFLLIFLGKKKSILIQSWVCKSNRWVFFKKILLLFRLLWNNCHVSAVVDLKNQIICYITGLSTNLHRSKAKRFQTGPCPQLF